MQTKCHADLPQTRSAQFILEYMNCARVFKALLGHGGKKKRNKRKKSCNSTCVFAVVQGNNAQILFLYVTSKELIIEWVYNSQETTFHSYQHIFL